MFLAHEKAIYIYKKHIIRTCLMYHAACKADFQPFKRSYSQLMFSTFSKIYICAWTTASHQPCKMSLNQGSCISPDLSSFCFFFHIPGIYIHIYAHPMYRLCIYAPPWVPQLSDLEFRRNHRSHSWLSCSFFNVDVSRYWTKSKRHFEAHLCKLRVILASKRFVLSRIFCFPRPVCSDLLQQ